MTDSLNCKRDIVEVDSHSHMVANGVPFKSSPQAEQGRRSSFPLPNTFEEQEPSSGVTPSNLNSPFHRMHQAARLHFEQVDSKAPPHPFLTKGLYATPRYAHEHLNISPSRNAHQITQQSLSNSPKVSIDTKPNPSPSRFNFLEQNPQSKSQTTSSLAEKAEKRTKSLTLLKSRLQRYAKAGRRRLSAPSPDSFSLQRKYKFPLRSLSYSKQSTDPFQAAEEPPQRLEEPPQRVEEPPQRVKEPPLKIADSFRSDSQDRGDERNSHEDNTNNNVKFYSLMKSRSVPVPKHYLSQSLRSQQPSIYNPSQQPPTKESPHRSPTKESPTQPPTKESPHRSPTYGPLPLTYELPKLEECPPISLPKLKCRFCKRNFFKRALEIHLKVCKKAFCDKKKQKGVVQKTKTEKPPTKKQNRKWKLQSQALRNGMRTAKAAKGGVNCRPNSTSQFHSTSAPSAATLSDPTLTPCEFCKRTFSEAAHRRHVKHCQHSKSRPKRLKKGDGFGAGALAMACSDSGNKKTQAEFHGKIGQENRLSSPPPVLSAPSAPPPPPPLPSAPPPSTPPTGRITGHGRPIARVLKIVKSSDKPPQRRSRIRLKEKHWR